MDVDPPSMPTKPDTTWPGVNSAGMNFFRLEGCFEGRQFGVFGHEPFAARAGFLFGATVVDVVEKLVDAEIAADLGVFILAELD